MQNCNDCDHPNTDNARFCEKCGSVLMKVDTVEIQGTNTHVIEETTQTDATVREEVQRNSTAFYKRKKLKISLLVALLLSIAVYVYPFVEREVFLKEYSDALLTSPDDYQWGVKIYNSRSGNEKVREVLIQYERDNITILLNQLGEYSAARKFFDQSLIKIEDLNLKNIFYTFEKRNFKSLVDEYVIETLEWSYDKKNVHVPTSYEHRLEKDFFGDWYVSTRVSQSAHDYTDYDGAYLHLTVQNKFLAIEILGDVGVSAKEYRDSYDKFSQGLGMMVWGALFGESGVNMISKTHDRETSINGIAVEACNEAHQVGKISLLSKRFEDGHEPKISWKSWSIRN